MSMRCAICVVTGNPPEGPLMPHLVTYRGYSLCDAHLYMWEDWKEVEWADIVELARRVKAGMDDPVTDVIDRVSVPQMDSDYSAGNLEATVTAVTGDGEEIPLEAGDFISTKSIETDELLYVPKAVTQHDPEHYEADGLHIPVDVGQPKSKEFDAVKAGGFKDPEDMMQVESLTPSYANLETSEEVSSPSKAPSGDLRGIPPTPAEEKLAEAKNKRRRRKKSKSAKKRKSRPQIHRAAPSSDPHRPTRRCAFRLAKPEST